MLAQQLFVRLDAETATVHRRHRDRVELEVELVDARVGDDVHAQPRRQGLVLGIADQVQEAVVHIVHPHDRRGRLGAVHTRIVELGAGGRLDGTGESGLPDGDGASERRAPELPGREPRRALRGQHRTEVQLQVPRVVRQMIADLLEGHGQATFRVSSPFCQLQGQSSSVCNASSTRSTSCGERPTLRSVM